MSDFLTHKRAPHLISYADCIPADFRDGMRSVHLTSASAPSVRGELSQRRGLETHATDVVIVFEDSVPLSECSQDVKNAYAILDHEGYGPRPDFVEESFLVHLSHAQAWALVVRLMSQLSYQGAQHGLEDPEQVLACRDSTLGHIAFNHLLRGVVCEDAEARAMLIRDGLIPAETDGERLGSALPPSINT